MAIFKPPRGSDEVLKEIVLEKGEIVYNTTDGKFYTGDDQTSGGILLNGGSAAPAPGPVSGEVTMDDVANVVLSAMEAHVEVADATYATKAEVAAIVVPEVSGFATKDELAEYATKAEIPEVSGFATKADLEAIEIPDVSGFATKEEVAAIVVPDVTGFATKEELSAHVAEADEKFITKTGASSLYSSKQETEEWINDLSGAVDAKIASEMGQLDEFATKVELNEKADKTALDTINDAIESKVSEADLATALSAKLDVSIYDTFHDEVYTNYASKYNLSKTNTEVAELKAAHAADVASLKAEIKVIKTAAKVEPYVPGESPAPTANDDVYIDSNAAISGNTTLSAKSLIVEDATISAPSGSVLVVTAQEEVVMDGTTFETHETKNANVAQVKDAETVILKGITFTGNSYNTLMTGQLCAEGKYIKDMVIEDCHFDDTCAHIYIWFAAFQDNATLTIRNCTFKDCEQVLCISDFHKQFDNKLTVKIENCTIENYDNYKPNNDGWYGIMLCDSRTTASMEDFKAKNPFGNGKVTIIIDNVTAKGVKLTQSNFIMGTYGTDQMLYVYVAKAKTNIFMDDPENAKYFPTVIVK